MCMCVRESGRGQGVGDLSVTGLQDAIQALVWQGRCFLTRRRTPLFVQQEARGALLLLTPTRWEMNG